MMGKLLIAYGTLTMNSEMVASKIYEVAVSSNKFSSVEIQNVYDIQNVNDLENYDYIIIGTSTWGEGEYPPDPEEFMQKVEEQKPNVAGKKFAFFGLGDTSYDHYCGAIIKMANYFIEHLNVIQVGTTHLVDGFPDDYILEKVEEWSKEIIGNLS